MSEQSAATERLLPTERTSRRHAVRRLAADMLVIFGETEDHWRSFTWQEGDRTYSLNRGDATQLQAEQTNADTNWLYVTGPDGEYDAFSLEPESDFAAPDQTFAELADALNRQASRAMYEAVSQRLARKSEDKNLCLTHQGVVVDFEDFTTAQHEPFIWVRVGERKHAIAYDLTADALRHTDPLSPYGPVPASAPQEAHTQWVLNALMGGEVRARDRLFAHGSRELGSRATTHAFEQRAPVLETDRRIGKYRIEETHAFMQELHNAEPADELYIKREPGATIVRTVCEMVGYDYSTQSGTSTPTVVGLRYTPDNLYFEAFPLDPAIGARTTILFDLAQRTAVGSKNTEHSGNETLAGDSAVDELFGHLDSLSLALLNGELQQCPPEAIARFNYDRIRHSTKDTVQ